MKNTITIVFLLVVAILLSVATGCKKSSSSPIESTDTDTTGGGSVVRKPNIYLYPQTKSIVSIKLEFPLGGTVIESIPAYQGEWVVEVEPSGKINGQYDYLFYESLTPDAYQYNVGWIIEKDSLARFFRTNLSVVGFNEREINDFTEYWIPKLSNYSYYIVYPQFINEIDRVIKLKVDKAPDNLLRLFYVIKGSETIVVNLVEPVIPKFNRNGFVVTEWGVVLK
jgi:hypothetical protein